MCFLRRVHLWAGIISAGLCGVVALAQPPLPVPTVQPPPAQPKADEETEVLARGPIHEAYASSGEVPTASPVVEKRPPVPVEELPPDQKPEGDNVLWIPGYWHYDEDRADFIWISGFWRNAPVGRVWVAGDWREAKGGYQWVPGFWNVVVQKQQPAELEYLPPPPELIEAGPSVSAPNDNCFYTPGCWVYRTNRYMWRPGYWVDHRPDWVWVPDHYRWTPVGYVFVPGYWDCPLETRGVLFAPVYFRAAALNRPRFVYTPAYAVPYANLHTCLFVRTGYVAYYFGDYFEPRYSKFGYNPWAGSAGRNSGFAVTVSVNRTSYDPLWSYYSLNYRDTPQWQTNVNAVYAGRYKGDVPRPPRTVVQQTNITNVTNNNTTVVVNSNAAPAVVTPFAEVQRSQGVSFRRVAADERVQEQKQAKELNQFAAERRKVETALVDKGMVVTKDEKPRQAKLMVPEGVAARAQVPVKAEIAPPPPATAAKKSDPKTDPVPTAKPSVKPATPPVIDPKTGAVLPRKLETSRSTDPVKPVDPTKPGSKPVDPKQPTDPKPLVKPDPKPTDPPKPPIKLTDPVKPVDPPKPGDQKPKDPVKPVDPPKLPVDPPKPKNSTKPPLTPPTPPKPVDPPKPIDPPKVDPPKQPVVVPPTTTKPMDPPKVAPPKLPDTPLVPPQVNPKPKDSPKVAPPKPPATPPVLPSVPPPVTPKPKDPPKLDPPKAPAAPTTPKPADPPKPAPPRVDPPKAPATPTLPPTKPKDEKPTTPPKPKEEKEKGKK